MADQGQDYLSLGLDVSGFDEAKKTRLNEFILLFEKLEKFDGKIYNPILGSGLTEFNAKLIESNKLLDEMNSKINSTNFANGFKNAAPAAKDLGNEVGSATTKVKDFGKEIDKTNSSLIQVGHGLKSMYNNIRIIAYILPGIGVAGIFDLIGRSILSAADYLLNLNSVIDTNISENTKLIETLADVNKLLRENIELNDGLADALNIEFKNEDLSYYEHLGEHLGFIIDKKIELNKLSLEEAQKAVNVSTGATGEQALQKQVYLVAKISEDLQKLNKQRIDLDNGILKIQRQPLGDVTAVPRRPGETVLTTKEDKDLFNKQIEDLEKYYKQQLDILNKFNSANKKLSDAQADKLKFDSDQARKLLVDRAKDDIAVEQEKSRIIIANIQSVHDERIKAIQDEKKQSEALAVFNRINVTGVLPQDVTKNRPLNVNLGATPDDVLIAFRKQNDEIKKAQEKAAADTLKENIDNYQKILLAKTEIAKNEVNTDSVNQEKIFNNEKASLSDRLAAYTKYIIDRAKLQELEYQKDIQAGKSSATDPRSSLNQEQALKLRSDRDAQILNQRADAEEKIYNIVYTSGQRQLKLIEDEFSQEGAYNKEALILDLQANNEKYRNREESLQKWLKTKKEIEERDKRESYQRNIDQDEAELKSLFTLYGKSRTQLNKSKENLDQANALPESPDKKFAVDQAQGAYEANLQVVTDIQKKITAVEKDESENRLKQAELEFQKKQDLYDGILRIEQALYNAVKDFGDAGYEYRLALLERNKAIIDEQYGYEQAAIEKSSLSQKDKNALSIQLAEQKREYDKKADADARRIKVQEAEFDKKLAIAKILIETPVNIIKDGATTPKAITDAIVGAIELAAVIATPIPSFSKGTRYFKGGIARYGEDGNEIISEPGKAPYLVNSETISYLPAGTEIIPVKQPPVFDTVEKDNDWDKFIWLAKQIKKSTPQKENITNVIKIDLGFENYKKSILGNGN